MADPAAPSNTIDDSVIQTWLAGVLNGDDPAWPAADENTVYALFFPLGATITSGGEKSCEAFGGYHDNITLDANHGTLNVAYAVVPRCGGARRGEQRGRRGRRDSFDMVRGHRRGDGGREPRAGEAATDPIRRTPRLRPGSTTPISAWLRARRRARSAT